MTDEIIQALLANLASIVPAETQLVADDACAGCGHGIRVVERGVGLCIVCHTPGDWSPMMRMAIQRQLVEAQEHTRHLAARRRGPSRAERVRAIRALAKCAVWSVPARHVCGECGASIKVQVGGQVLCPGCQTPLAWSAVLRDQVQSLAIGAWVGR